MTAALRGFNMELNAESAQRVNDVYSNLAAKTASDTREIAEAMTKTASIAHNAGLSFETTAAFLTQAIETTREAPENIGTAMKTVIARFQELKKLPDGIGEIDGEAVDANRIDKALREVGIALRETSGEFRALDDVFVELASKWDTLDMMQQRYIATQAAGSRQQSRFIAMMSNFGRTSELLAFANDAMGASQEQFNKTLDSAEAKLNQLKNGWDNFTMGILNSTVFKFAIDGFTSILQLVNGLTDGLGAIGGLMKGGMLFGGLLGGGQLLKGGIGELGKAFRGEQTASALGMLKTLLGKETGLTNKANWASVITKSAESANTGMMTLFNTTGQLYTAMGDATKSAATFGGTLKGAMGGISKAAFGTVGGVILTTGVLITLFNLVQKAIEDNSLESKVDRSREAVLDLEKVLDDARLSLDNFEEAKNRIGDNQDAFSTLAEGTAEWNEHLQKSNEHILDLIDKFPELKAGFTVDGDGAFGITKEAMDALEKALKKQAEVARLAKLGQIIQGERLSQQGYTDRYEREQERFGAAEKEEKRKSRTHERSRRQEDITAAAARQATREEAINLNELKYQNEMLKSTNNITNSIKAELQNGIKAENRNATGLNSVVDFLAKSISDRDDELINGIRVRDSLNSKSKDELLALRAGQSGISVDELSDATKNMGVAELREVIAATTLVADAVERTNSIMERIESGDLSEEALKALVAAQGDKVSFKDLESMSQMTDEQLRGLFTQEDLKLLAGSDLEEDISAFINSLKTGIESVVESTQVSFDTLSKLMGEKFSKDLQETGIDPQAFQATTNKVVEMFSLMGVEGGEKFARNVLSVLKNVAPDELDEVITLINSIDPQSPHTIDQLIDYLGDIGINMPEAELDIFINQLREIAAAAGAIDLEEMRRLMMGSNSLYEKAQGGETVFSMDEVTQIQQLAPKLYDAFQAQADGTFRFTGVQQELISEIQNGWKAASAAHIDGAEAFIQETKEIASRINAKEIDIAIKANDIESQRRLHAQAFGDNYQDPAVRAKLAAIPDEQLKQALLGVIDRLEKGATDAANLKMAKSMAEAPLGGAVGSTMANGDKVSTTGSRLYDNTRVSQGERYELRYTPQQFTGPHSAVQGIQTHAGAVDDPKRIEITKQHTEALIEHSREAGINEQKIKALETAYANHTAQQTKATAKQLENAAAAAEQSIEYENAMEKWYGNIEIMEEALAILNNAEIVDGGIVEATEAQRRAAEDYAAALEEVSGMEFSADWILDNMDLINQFAEGVISVEELMITSAMNAAGQTELMIGDVSMSVSGLIDFINGSYAELGVGGAVDFTAIHEALAAVGMNGQQIQEFLNGLGFDGRWVLDSWTPISIPTFTSARRASASAGGPTTGFDTYTVYGTRLEYMPNYKFVGTKRASTPPGLTYSPRSSSSPNMGRGGSGGGGGGRKPSGGGGGRKPSGSGGGSKGKGEDEKEVELWENHYDFLYNTETRLNYLGRQRNKIQYEYNELLKSGKYDLQAVLKLRNKELRVLEEQRNWERIRLKERLKEMDRIGNTKFAHDETTKTFDEWGVGRYARYEEATNSIKINWDLIDQITDMGTGEAVAAYIDYMEEIVSKLEDAEDQLVSIETEIKAVLERGREEYLQLEREAYQAIVAEHQKEIDELADLSDEIAQGQQKQLELLADSINLQRQIRDNTRAEEEIAEKERQLAYLRRDPSIGNQTKIAALERELRDRRQSLGDSLIDQRLAELQKQTDQAAEQRQQQIEIMQEQLNYMSESGAFWPQIYAMMEKARQGDTAELTALFQKHDGYNSMSKFAQQAWGGNWAERLNMAMQGLQSFLTPKQEEIIQNEKPTTVQDAQEQIKQEPKPPTPKPAPQPTPKAVTVGGSVKANPAAKIYAWRDGSGAGGQYFRNDPIYRVLQVVGDWIQVRHRSQSSGITGWFKKNDLTAFKAGGMADFTGPAWLDGTRTKPEAVLDAEDTRNFIQLKDILSKTIGKDGTSNTFGDTNNTVNIYVDSIASDSQIDKLTAKIKREIGANAQYRNAVNVSRRR